MWNTCSGFHFLTRFWLILLLVPRLSIWNYEIGVSNSLSLSSWWYLFWWKWDTINMWLYEIIIYKFLEWNAGWLHVLWGQVGILVDNADIIISTIWEVGWLFMTVRVYRKNTWILTLRLRHHQLKHQTFYITLKWPLFFLVWSSAMFFSKR